MVLSSRQPLLPRFWEEIRQVLRVEAPPRCSSRMLKRRMFQELKSIIMANVSFPFVSLSIFYHPSSSIFPCSTESDDDIVLRVPQTVARLHGECPILGNFNALMLTGWRDHVPWQIRFPTNTRCCRRGVPATSSDVTHSIQDRSIAIQWLMPVLLSLLYSHFSRPLRIGD